MIFKAIINHKHMTPNSPTVTNWTGLGCEKLCPSQGYNVIFLVFTTNTIAPAWAPQRALGWATQLPFVLYNYLMDHSGALPQ